MNKPEQRLKEIKDELKRHNKVCQGLCSSCQSNISEEEGILLGMEVRCSVHGIHQIKYRECIEELKSCLFEKLKAKRGIVSPAGMFHVRPDGDVVKWSDVEKLLK